MCAPFVSPPLDEGRRGRVHPWERRVSSAKGPSEDSADSDQPPGLPAAGHLGSPGVCSSRGESCDPRSLPALGLRPPPPLPRQARAQAPRMLNL